MTDRKSGFRPEGWIPMDPESNWDICPVCHEFLAGQDDFPGIEAMRAHHRAHKGDGATNESERGV